ncbi:hypothetical protein AB0M46_06315 [Dactylosporangium sp. NPDC051485]
MLSPISQRRMLCLLLAAAVLGGCGRGDAEPPAATPCYDSDEPL